MPMRARRQCTFPGCTELATYRGRCKSHMDTRPSPAARGYDARWRFIRAAFIKAHPWCEHPEHAGQFVRGEEVDHVVPLANGGTNAASNLQTLCKSHHSQKTFRQNFGGGGG